MAKSQNVPMKTLTLHIKILVSPVGITIRQMMTAMNNLFSQANIFVNLISREELELSDNKSEFFNELDVGSCNVRPTDEQRDLARIRDNIDGAVVVVYICNILIGESTIYDGCSTHPAGVPMAVIRRLASPFTLAHEIGHLLGLKHCSERHRDNIMHPDPPLIVPGVWLRDHQIDEMRQSPLLTEN